jgi:Z1 domain
MIPAHEQVRQMVRTLLRNESQITTAIIAEKVTLVSQIVPGAAGIDSAALVKELETAFSVWMASDAALDNNEDHIPWLPEKRLAIKWRFWNRYHRFLEEEKKWAPKPIDRLDEITSRVLERLEDPQRTGAWDRRGMVVGQVQSGKTANYSGLICKAADAGYKLVIVLAGLHNNLRSQTQQRLDESFLGFDTEGDRAYSGSSRRVGVGRLMGEPWLAAHTLTSSADLGDFNKKVAKQAGVDIRGADPVLLVVKKNKSVLQNLFAWATEVAGVVDPDTRKTLVRDVPLLVIDDEADNASVNTQPVVDADTGEAIADAEVSQINKLIRQLLNSFEKSAYVGYTATPFANIFIDPDVEHEDVGADLFPRSFIIALPEPTNYVGPVQVFGLSDELGEVAREPMPVIRKVRDYAGWLPDGHKKDHSPGPLPPSLREAIRAFVVSCAARIARGQEKEHMSMLVHVTRFTAVQQTVRELVEKETKFLRRQLEFTAGEDSAIVVELKKLWDRDFVPTSACMNHEAPSWSDVASKLAQAATKISVRTVNGNAEDILDYTRHPNGLTTIAVGGDKLSRGLTLEGLMVSYYLRPSKMYDSLMQMGRWFGYRPGYVDLCRLYTTEELISWYQHVTVASEELRREFEHMAALGKDPSAFGLRVRSHPAGLIITAANKMKSGTPMSVSYAGAITETIQFEKDSIASNLAATERLVRKLGVPSRAETAKPVEWQDVGAADVLSFLRDFSTHPNATKARGPLLVRYIEAQLSLGELTAWTVVLINKKPDTTIDEQDARPRSHQFGDIVVALSDRALEFEGSRGFTAKRIVDPSHERIGLDEGAISAALDATQEQWRQDSSRYKDKTTPPSRPSGQALRDARSPRNGLLLMYPMLPHLGEIVPVVGLAISFPGSPKAKAVDYVVNNVYWEQLA